MSLPLIWILALQLSAPVSPEMLISKRVAADFPLTADPAQAQWREVSGITATNDALGNPTPGHETEIKSRWSDRHIYFLFVCPYGELNLKPNPSLTTETARLWEWDVAEVFVGADFENIRHYREFQISPQGEWIDLDIHSDDLNAERDMKWDSGYSVKARLDQEHKVWYGEMKIPIAAIDAGRARTGKQMRVNFYRLQGPGSARKQIVWRATGRRSHHVPESFGLLVLED